MENMQPFTASSNWKRCPRQCDRLVASRGMVNKPVKITCQQLFYLQMLGHKQVQIVHNCLHNLWLSLARKICKWPLSCCTLVSTKLLQASGSGTAREAPVNRKVIRCRTKGKAPTHCRNHGGQPKVRHSGCNSWVANWTAGSRHQDQAAVTKPGRGAGDRRKMVLQPPRVIMSLRKEVAGGHRKRRIW